MRNPLKNSLLLAAALSLALATLTSACGDAANEAGTAGADFNGGAEGAGGGGAGITQAGAQDFGLFRQILEAGQIPAPSTIDDLGFFAEHKLEYPAPDCGDDVCVHALLGVMGNMITGSNCTMIQIGMNTPIDPTKIERPPLHLVLAIDVSGSMQGAPIDSVKQGLSRMLDHLEDGDIISLVTYSSAATVVLEAVPLAEQKQEIDIAFKELAANGKTNIYDGLFTAFSLADQYREEGQSSRVILLSDGAATTGIENIAKTQSLAEAWAKTGVGLTTIGVGEDFEVDLMRGLAEVGAGNFYFLEDPTAVKEVFTEEVKTFLFPVALDVEIDVAAGPGYTVRQAYGTNGWSGGFAGGTVSIPTLFIAGRTDVDEPIEDGRRGGGGAIMLEMLPNFATNLSGQLTPDELAHVGTVELAFTDPVSGVRKTQTIKIDNPYEPGDWPEEGHFSDETVQKGFVMLNILVGFQMAAALAQDSDPGGARGLLENLRGEVTNWLDRHPDPDIEDDLKYIDLFIANLQADTLFQTPVTAPPEPWPSD